MSSRSVLAGLDLHAIQQVVKWIVYAILIVKFFFYVQNDIEVAVHGLRGGGSFLRWTTTFATTIDELGWFMLLILFELETYSLSEEVFEGITGKVIRGIRVLCYVFLAHTIYAYYGDVQTLTGASPSHAYWRGPISSRRVSGC